MIIVVVANAISKMQYVRVLAYHFIDLRSDMQNGSNLRYGDS
jgi:hypothetical protein